MTTFITYQGAIVATASQLRVHFTPPLDTAPPEDPLRRFVVAMGAYAADVAAGRLEGPYTDEAAEMYARTMLISDTDFEANAGQSDEDLAERYGVPVEQIELKREDVSA